MVFYHTKEMDIMKKLMSSKNRLLTGISFLLIVFSFLVSCTKNSDMPGLNEVFIHNGAFDPVTITVSENTIVTWTNKDDIAHTVTGTDFDSGPISTNGIWTHKFTTADSYPYHCTFHPNMTAKVTVN
jgi:plastocyanin